jgi:hypothetical protein
MDQRDASMIREAADRPRELEGETRAHALTEYTIVVAVIVLGITAVLVLMHGATSADVAALVGSR